MEYKRVYTGKTTVQGKVTKQCYTVTIDGKVYIGCVIEGR